MHEAEGHHLPARRALRADGPHNFLPVDGHGEAHVAVPDLAVGPHAQEVGAGGADDDAVAVVVGHVTEVGEHLTCQRWRETQSGKKCFVSMETNY